MPLSSPKTCKGISTSRTSQKGSRMHDPHLVNRDPSVKYFLKHCRGKEKLIFITYNGKLEGVIEKVLEYELKLQGRDELLSKVQILFVCKPDTSDAVGRGLTFDQEVVEEHLEAPIKWSSRLKIPTKILKKWFKEKRPIEVTLRTGYVLRGRLHSYGIFSLRLELEENARVIIMRPSIYDLNYRVRSSSPPDEADVSPAVSR